jgi:UDP-N-acetylglucosamine diphosphorylase/glucosamine-1-phosphate N-acetyltransferase
MTSLFLYDDAVARQFEPFALTRPACELRAGALLLRERWERALGMGAAAVVTSQHLADFDEPWGIGAVSGTLPRGSILAHSRCAVGLGPVQLGEAWMCGSRVAAVLLPRDVPASELATGELTLDSLAREGGRRVEVAGRWMTEIWDFIAQLAPMLTEDIAVLSREARRLEPAEFVKTGRNDVFMEEGGTIEPQVFFDTNAGPVLVRKGATIQAFTRIVGPAVIGKESTVGGDKIATVSVGEVCKVHGEVSVAIILGHSNKGHDGFLGHSYLGRWVNLGAGTITSNLKNTYGSVQLWTPRGTRDTGQQFLGTLFGDHSKTGIGMSLNTGTVIGAGANVFGSLMPPKVIAPFSWGDTPPYSTYRLDKFLEVATRMMSRRHVELSPRQVRALTASFERRWGAERA